MSARERIDRLRGKMRERGLDAVLLWVFEGFNWESVYYLSGFRGSSSALLVTLEAAELITDGRYLLQASAQVPRGVMDVVDQQSRKLAAAIADRLKFFAPARAGVEFKKLFHAPFLELSQLEVTSFEDVSDLLPALRRRKDAGEIAAIREAATRAGAAFFDALGAVKPGMTEREFAALLEYRMRIHQAEGGWGNADFIVLTGARSAMPHGRPSDEPFKTGDWVCVDFGARYDGYVSDITRYFSLGPPREDAQRWHEVLLRAHNQAAAKLVAGVAAADVDRVARGEIERAGWGERFTHGLGHGIGLEVHEAPNFSKLEGYVLEAGDVVTIEPGIYFDGTGGLRLEDDYCVTAGGSERLTAILPQEFFVV